jgi:hypothetical protein
MNILSLPLSTLDSVGVDAGGVGTAVAVAGSDEPPHEIKPVKSNMVLVETKKKAALLEARNSLKDFLVKGINVIPKLNFVVILKYKFLKI